MAVVTTAPLWWCGAMRLCSAQLL
eukprot:COSAG02_NODE_38405_length_429_cov_0.990909_1_plen_23_part_01